MDEITEGRGLCPSPLEQQTLLPAERNPFRVYLARLAAGSRPTMAEALESIARIASGGNVEADRFPWHALRYQHVQAIRAAELRAPGLRCGATHPFCPLRRGI